MSSSKDEEDRVWIMDPDVLEESAREHRDSPHRSPHPHTNPHPLPAQAQPPGGRYSNSQYFNTLEASPRSPFRLGGSGLGYGGAEAVSVISDGSGVTRNDSGLFFRNEPHPQTSLLSSESSEAITPLLPQTSPAMSTWRPSSGNVAKSFNRPVNNVGALGNGDTDLSIMEKQYLLACERGDLASVRHYLKVASANPDFNINCLDPLGRTALLIAIENENIEMIETLLDVCIETGDAILYAINEENVEAVEIILNHLERIDKFSPENQGVEINEHSAFTPDITPIILAAHRDNYEIIKLLLDRGASIPHPHDVRCDCRECLAAVAEDSLRLSRSRINAYRALASPSLVCLSARDPILYAFELSWELRRLSYIENEFKAEYQELSQKCQKFSTDLLDQTRGSKELEIILNHDTSDRWPIRDRAPGERMQLARLKLAVQFRQKRFVSHANCQQLLASIWYEGLPGFRRRNIVFKVLLILAVSMASPFLALIYLMFPKSSIGHIIRKPFIKFLCHSASYVIFLVLLILASQRINWDGLMHGNQEEMVPSGGTKSEQSSFARKERRGPAPTPVEWAIMAWVAGLIWVEVKQLWDTGLYEYCHNMWNILDFITNSLYLCTITLRIIAFIQVEAEKTKCRNDDQEYKDLIRKNWHAWDPTLISECIFATANIFSSLKLVHIFTVNPHLGPLQISLGRMVIDILKFFFVYCLVLFAFACGLNQLFWYYASMRSEECNKSKDPVANALSWNETKEFEESCDPKHSSFANLFNTLETLFWSIFGLIDLEHLRLKEDHKITEWAGKTMFGTYGIISIVVLLNMLIAMMSNSYQYISNQSDIEWKFARSRLWIEYFEEGGTLPPPFNIIPSPKSFYYVLRWFCDKFCKCSRRIQQTKQRSLRLQKILKAVSQKEANYQKTLKKVSEREAMYKFVMRNLVKRYIAHIQRIKQNSEGVSEDDVNEIKQDISAFRYELLEILKNAGMETGHSNYSQKASRSKKRSAQKERRLMKGFQLNVDPIPEVDRFLPKLPSLDSNRFGTTKIVGGRVSSQPSGLSASRPIVASAPSAPSPAKIHSSPGAFSSSIQRFRKLSRKLPLGRRSTAAGTLSGAETTTSRISEDPTSVKTHLLSSISESQLPSSSVLEMEALVGQSSGTDNDTPTKSSLRAQTESPRPRRAVTFFPEGGRIMEDSSSSSDRGPERHGTQATFPGQVESISETGNQSGATVGSRVSGPETAPKPTWRESHLPAPGKTPVPKAAEGSTLESPPPAQQRDSFLWRSLSNEPQVAGQTGLQPSRSGTAPWREGSTESTGSRAEEVVPQPDDTLL